MGFAAHHMCILFVPPLVFITFTEDMNRIIKPIKCNLLHGASDAVVFRPALSTELH